jgi:hypothetical protein
MNVADELCHCQNQIRYRGMESRGYRRRRDLLNQILDHAANYGPGTNQFAVAGNLELIGRVPSFM